MNRHPFPKATSLPHRLFSWAGLFSLILALACSGAPVHAKPVIGHDASTSRHEIVFVESNVGDYQGLLNGVNPAMETHVLDADHDGLADMAQILLGRKDIDAIHIVSHGSEGAVLLGALNLTSQNLQDHTADLATIGSALEQNGNILLYGCNVARGTIGNHFVNRIGQLTGKSVAASTDATGSQALSANWTLESHIGNIHSSSLSFPHYSSILANGTLTFTADGGGAWSGGVATDGEGGSTDLLGIVIQVFNIIDTSGSNLGAISWEDNNFLFSNNPLYSGLTYNQNAGSKGMEIRSSDGSEFQINQFTYYNWGESAVFTNTVKGYRNGSEVASMTFNGFDAGYNPITVSLDSTFDNVDDVRIYISAGGYLGDQSATNHSINSIVIADAITAPGAPTIGTATAGNTQATVAFTPPASDGGSAITGYTATSNPGGITGSGASSPITVTGLTNGTAYTFTITATNSIGTGSASAASNSVTPKANQTITFANPGTQNFGTTPTLSATASSGLTVSFTSSTTGVCTITSGGALTFATTGTCTIDADQAGNAAYNAAPTVSQSFTVNAVAPGAPTIGTATDAVDTQASVAFSAPASDGGSAITGYTATSNPGGLTGSGASSPITVIGLTNGTAYTFTVTATNSIGTGSASAASNSVTPKANQTIYFGNPGTQYFGTTPTLSATASSGLTVSFTSSTTGVCTITSGGTLTFVTSGTCTIDADQSGNSSYLAAPTVSQSFTVNAVVPGAPTIGTATAGNTQATVAFSAPASDGGSAITGYTATSNPGGLTGSGASSPITVTGLTNSTAYTFTVTATNSIGTGSASAASNSVTPKASQTITFSNPGAQNFGTTPTLSATADSGLTVSFTSSTTGVCTITTGGALTFVTTGTCTIDADQSGNSSYLAAPTVSQSFTVNAVVPGAPTIGTATAGNTQATVAFSAPASDGGSAITGYTATSNPGGFTGSGLSSPITVTGLTNGTAYTFTVTATNSAGTGSASADSNSVTPKAGQTITFSNPGAQNFGTTPTLSATSTSGLTVSFTSSTTGVCTITSGGALTFVTTGTCTIDADQSGNSSYLAASTVSRSFSVNAVVPGAPTIGTATAGDSQATVAFSAPASNGGATITGYTATSNPGGLTGSGASSPITVIGLTNGTAYTFTVTATNSAGTGNPSAASNSVTPIASQTITFSNPGAQNFGTTPTLSATADSGLTVSFTSSTTGVCTITSGGALIFVTTGTCTIDADQSGNSSYLAAPTVSQSFTVNAVVPGAPTIGTATAGDTQATVAFSAPASNGGATITGYTATSNPGGLTGSGASSPITVIGLTNGTAYTFTVTATNSIGTGNPSAASNSITPAPGPTVISVAVPANGTYKVGSNLDFTISWDKNTTVSGTPQIALTIGTATVKANYLSSPNATTSLFRYSILAGQNDSDGIVVDALTLNGGTIRDANNVNATLTLNNVADTTGLLVDTTTPTVTINQAVGQTDPTNSSPIRFDVEFGEAVTGFNNADVIIAGMAMTPNITVSDSGDHIRYSVEVTGMTEGETVTATIPADAALDSSGNLSVASSSTDNSVTYRTTRKFPWLLLQPALNYNGVHRSAILPAP